MDREARSELLAMMGLVAAVVAVVILRRRLGGLEWRRLGPVLGQILVAGAATGAASWLVARWVAEALGTASLGPQLLQVGGGLAAGLGTFLALAMAFRMQELALIKQTVLARLGRR
jgi:putative peptidoglycan lipid II flippase